jgi:mannose-6-phosphate isomerase-like protein (cupin superfamily)
MAGYAKVNLRELEDSTDAEGIEGRFARSALESRDLGVSLFNYAPNQRAGVAHQHREQEEAYIVVRGSGRLLLDDQIVDVVPWDVVRVAPEVTRAFEAGAEGLEFIAVGGPKPEGGDGVRVDDPWPGAGDRS